MNFDSRYELERLIADGEIKSFRAREKTSGRIVFLHLFNPEGQAVLTALKSRLALIPGKPVFPLLDLGEFADSPFAVTEPIAPFTNLREWVSTLGATPPPAAGPEAVVKAFEQARPAVKDSLTEEESAAFERLFERRQRPPEKNSPPEVETETFSRLFAPFVQPPSSPPPVVNSPPVAKSEAFTQLFEPGKQLPPTPLGGDSPPIAKSEVFTQLFEPGKQTPPTPPVANSPPAGKSEVFTQLYEPVKQPPTPPVVNSPPVAKSGAFTQFFEPVQEPPLIPPGNSPRAGEIKAVSKPLGPAKQTPGLPPPLVKNSPPAGQTEIFTKIIDPKLRPAAPAPVSDEEFMRLFDAPAASAKPQPPAIKTNDSARWLNPGPGLRSTVPLPADPASGGGEFEKLFDSPAAQDPEPQDPGNYARIMASVGVKVDSRQTAERLRPSVPRGVKTKLGILIGFGIGLLMILIAFLAALFATRR